MRKLKNPAYLASIFRQPFIRRLIAEGPGELAATLNLAAFPYHARDSVAAAYEAVYASLLSSYRCEYIYKNTVASKILIGRHSPRTATLLTELSVGDSKVDLVLLNGRSIAYEIKTELDTCRRLPVQVHDYQTVFDRVYVVGHGHNAEQLVTETPGSVGVLVLTREHRLREIRKPVDAPFGFDKVAAFNMLRRHEFLAVIRRHYGSVPKLPNTKIYRACRDLFLELSAQTLRADLMIALKTRRTWSEIASHLDSVPYALRFHAVTGNLQVDRLPMFSQPLGHHRRRPRSVLPLPAR